MCEAVLILSAATRRGFSVARYDAPSFGLYGQRETSPHSITERHEKLTIADCNIE